MNTAGGLVSRKIRFLDFYAATIRMMPDHAFDGAGGQIRPDAIVGTRAIDQRVFPVGHQDVVLQIFRIGPVPRSNARPAHFVGSIWNALGITMRDAPGNALQNPAVIRQFGGNPTRPVPGVRIGGGLERFEIRWRSSTSLCVEPLEYVASANHYGDSIPFAGGNAFPVDDPFGAENDLVQDLAITGVVANEETWNLLHAAIIQEIA